MSFHILKQEQPRWLSLLTAVCGAVILTASLAQDPKDLEGLGALGLAFNVYMLYWEKIGA